MGRKRLPIKLIENEKKRRETYEKRKTGLKKKCYELATLCDVQVGMILYGPMQGDCPVEVETFPEAPEEVRPIIQRYQKVPEEDKHKRRQDISGFFQERTKKTEVDIEKLRKTTDDKFHHDLKELSLEQLQQILQRLGPQIESVDEIIQKKKAQDYPNVALNYETLYSSLQNTTSYDQGAMLRNDLLCRQQLGHAASSTLGVWHGQLFDGVGASDHHHLYNKRKFNHYEFDSNPVMFDAAQTYANIAYDHGTLSMGNTDYGYPGQSAINMIPTPSQLPWQPSSMPGGGYSSQMCYHQPSPNIMQQGGYSSAHEHQQLFNMNSFSGASLCQMINYPSEESISNQEHVNKYTHQ